MDSLQDQTFLYREVPVNYDGTGTITDIKGNTISFNQLVQNGNFVDSSNWAGINTPTLSFANNICTITTSRQNSGIQQSNINMVKSHVYFMKASVKNTGTAKMNVSGLGNVNIAVSSSFVEITNIFTLTTATGTYVFQVLSATGDATTIDVTNAMLFDLTAMGIDNLTTTAQVEEWLSTHLGNLPYYDYTTGKLISFNGTGLKTTGKNLVFDTIQHANIASNGVIGSTPSVNYDIHIAKVIKGETYYVSSDENELVIGYFTDVPSVASTTYNGSRTLTTNHVITAEIDGYIGFRTTYGYQYPMIEFGSSPTTYEAYQSNTLSLPTPTYFPFGEDGIGTVRDELIPNTDVYKRMGIVDLGNLTWEYSDNNFSSSGIIGVVKKPSSSAVVANIKCANYVTMSRGDQYPVRTTAKTVSVAPSGTLYISDPSYTDVSTFKSAMANQYLVYELSTPLHNYGVVDLGELEWQYDSTYSRFYSAGIKDIIKKPSANTDVANIVCKDYLVNTSNSTASVNMTIGVASIGWVQIRNTDYNDTAVFKNSLSGKYLLYALETPVAPSVSDLTYPIWQNGTEQILPENTSTPVTSPILCDIDYRTMIPVNATDNPDGSGTITGTGNYRYHSMATLTATPTDEIYRFLRWEDENGNTLSTNSTYSFTVGE